MKHFDHALFASLSFAAPETWIDVMMSVGTFLEGLLGSVILHSWSNKILFCTSASSVPLVSCQVESQSCNGMSYEPALISEKKFSATSVRRLLILKTFKSCGLKTEMTP